MVSPALPARSSPRLAVAMVAMVAMAAMVAILAAVVTLAAAAIRVAVAIRAAVAILAAENPETRKNPPSRRSVVRLALPLLRAKAMLSSAPFSGNRKRKSALPKKIAIIQRPRR